MCKEKTAGSAQIVELRFIGGWVEFYLIEGVYLCFPSLLCFVATAGSRLPPCGCCVKNELKMQGPEVFVLFVDIFLESRR